MRLVRGIVTVENLQEVCKVCLEVKPIRFNLSSKIEFNFPCTLSIGDILNKITSERATIQESHPNIVCSDCIFDLRTAYILFVKYEESKKIIQEFVSTHVKKEIIESENGEIVDIKVSTETEVYNGLDNQPQFNQLTQTQPLKQVQNQLNVKKYVKKKEKLRKPILHACPVCNLEFTALHLRDHVHTHKTLKKYLNIPEEVKVNPNAKFSTLRHIMNPQISFFKRPEKIYKCPYCNLEFSIGNFAVHFDSHRVEGDYKCDKCGRQFRRINHLNTHRVKHLKELPYKCGDCNKGFILKENYDCHILTHLGGELPHQCLVCLKRFANPRDLYRHQFIHTHNVNYSVKYKTLRCTRCLRTFNDKTQMNSHPCVATEKAVKGKIFCKFCRKTFKSHTAFRNHQEKSHKVGPRKMLCSICGAYVSSMYAHMLKHTGEKPHECPHCEKKFAFKQRLQCHILQHTGEKPYQCEQCGKRFTAPQNLKNHIFQHTGLRPFVCGICGKDFNNLNCFRAHEKIHKGNRCHVCPVCGHGFLERSYLNRHMKLHCKTKVT